MDFKNVIIMSDLDGTLLDDKKEISPRAVSYTHLTLPTKLEV